MVKETDILYLSKEDAESLDSTKKLEGALKTTLKSTSNREILAKLLEFDLLLELVN